MSSSPHIPRDAADQAAGAEGRSVRREIEDEIADHLAALKAELGREHKDAIVVDQLARQRFGFIPRIVRQCLWIQDKEQIMLRYTTLALLAVLSLSVVALGLGAYRANQNFADRMDALTTQLGALNDLQQQLAKRQLATVPEIRGHAYLGKPEVPAKQADIELRRLPSGEIYRRLVTDDEGNFVAADLPEGDYFVLASLVGKDNPLIDKEPNYNYVVQSRPLTLARGGLLAEVDLDLKYGAGDIRLELVGPLPDSVACSEGLASTNFPADFPISVQVQLVPRDFKQELPWTTSAPMPESWPVRGYREIFPLLWGQFPPSQFNRSGDMDISRPFNQTMMPAIEYEVRAALLPGFSPKTQTLTIPNMKSMAIDSYWKRKYLLKALGASDELVKFRQKELGGYGVGPIDKISGDLRLIKSFAPLVVRVENGHQTRLRLKVPPNYVENLTSVLASIDLSLTGQAKEDQLKRVIAATRPVPLQIDLVE